MLRNNKIDVVTNIEIEILLLMEIFILVKAALF